MITTDVASAYYEVPLHKESQPYCAWFHDGKWYKPTILVFGLSIAPFIFTKIMKVPLTFMRSLDICGSNCIDDNIWMGPPEEMAEVAAVVRLVYETIGWIFNAKCSWEPSACVIYNGM